MYMDGRGVAKDEKKGAQLLLQAAEKGLADAQSDIGNCYYRGKGVCRDYSLALLFFRKAAEQNNARAFFSIGAVHSILGTSRFLDWSFQSLFSVA